MEKAIFIGLMGASTVGSGKVGNKMEEESTLVKMEFHRWEYGRKVNECSG